MGSEHILVVDDHKSIREPLAQFLRKNGYRTSVAGNALQADEVLRKSRIDLIILDIMMPGETGLEICRRIRVTHDIPTIFLTAVVDETDKIIGLEMGADDYVTKPFNPRELLARVKGVLRRSNALPRQYSELESGFIQFGNWQLDLSGRSLIDLTETFAPVALSTAEFKLLSTFLAHSRIVLSRDQLLDHVSGRDAVSFDRSIDNQVSRLRKKIEVDPKNPKLIKTVLGGDIFSCDVIQT